MEFIKSRLRPHADTVSMDDDAGGRSHSRKIADRQMELMETEAQWGWAI